MAKIKLGMKAEVVKGVVGTIQSTGKPYYKVIVEQDGEVTSLSCAEIVYAGIVAEKGNEVNMVVEFNEEYKKLRVISVITKK
jgi:hypothetical protein